MAVRLLETPPVYCSACWCAYPDKRHVDYASDNDQGYGGNTSIEAVPYDNLQLCEDCMKAGAALVGMVDASEREQELSNLRIDNDRLKREATSAQNYADRIEDAVVNHRAKPIEINHRRKPRPIHPVEA